MAVLPHGPQFDVRIDDASPSRLLFRANHGEQALDPKGTARPSVADVIAGPESHSWRIQTTAFELPFPSQLRLVSSADPSVPPGFDLIGPSGELIYFQGPASQSAFSLEHLVARGERLQQHDPGPPLSVTVTYAHGDQRWWQVRNVVPLSTGLAVLVALQTTHQPTPSQLAQLVGVASSVQQFQPAA